MHCFGWIAVKRKCSGLTCVSVTAEPVDEEETSGGLLDTGWDVKTTEGANTKTSLTTGLFDTHTHTHSYTSTLTHTHTVYPHTIAPIRSLVFKPVLASF